MTTRTRIPKPPKTMTEERPAESFFNSLRDNPDKLIEWAEREIKEYQELIRLIREARP